MMAGGMLSLLSGLAQGTNSAQQQQIQNKHAADELAIQQQTAQQQQTQFDQQQADRTAFRAAGAPVAATTDVDASGNPVNAPIPGADNPDAGQWDAPVQQQAQTVQGQSGLTPMQAAAATTAANAPDAVAARQLAVLQQQNPAAAAGSTPGTSPAVLSLFPQGGF